MELGTRRILARRYKQRNVVLLWVSSFQVDDSHYAMGVPYAKRWGRLASSCEDKGNNVDYGRRSVQSTADQQAHSLAQKAHYKTPLRSGISLTEVLVSRQRAAALGRLQVNKTMHRFCLLGLFPM